MTAETRTLASDYMNFAKLRTGAACNLATSGVADCHLEDLGAELTDLGLHGPNPYGYAPLVETIAARFSVDPACVVIPGGGCSFANHLALAAILAPGDEVLVEDPTYELLLATLGYLRARITRIVRRTQDDYAIDIDALTAKISDKTRLVVLTNLHNPSSALAPAEAIQAAADSAARVGARVLVDEVYLDLAFGDGKGRTAFQADGAIITTNSLTKAYGLSGLRCGWILAPAPLAERMRRLNDLFGVQPPHISERLGLFAFGQLPRLRARADGMINLNRAAYGEFLGGHPALDQILFDQGTTVFPRLLAGDGDALFDRLTARFDTSIVPGRFFGRPDHFRVGLGGDPVMTRTGLQRLAQALEDWPN